MTAYTYDGNDNLTKRRTPKGDDILFAYDKGGREYLFDGWIAFKTPDPFFVLTPVNVGNVTSYIAGNLKAGTTYFFSVTAYDQSGNESLHSSEVSKSIY